LVAVVVFLIIESLFWLLLAPLLEDFTDNFVWSIACLAISLFHVEASWALIAKKRHARITTLIVASMNWLFVLASVVVALALIIINPSDLEYFKVFGYFGSIVVIAFFVAIPTFVFATSYTNLLLRESSKKWFEDMNSPKRNIEKKFFIPLVVFLLSATVAGALIFTFSLFSDDGPGKERRAKTAMRIAITEVRSTQNGSGDSDFANINLKVLSENNSNITWVNTNLTDENEEFAVAPIELTDTKIVMQTTDGKTCFFSELNADGPIRTRYGTSGIKDGICFSTARANGGNDFVDDMQFGWR